MAVFTFYRSFLTSQINGNKTSPCLTGCRLSSTLQVASRPLKQMTFVGVVNITLVTEVSGFMWGFYLGF